MLDWVNFFLILSDHFDFFDDVFLEEYSLSYLLPCLYFYKKIL